MKKTKKVYSGIDEIPTGNSEENSVKGCMVLEGGAFKGTYSSGVLDYLMQNGINLETTIGVSAGAMNGMLYTSGNIGRAARTNLGYRYDSRYVGLSSYHKKRGIIGFDFAFKELNSVLPIDEERLSKTNRRFIAVATCLEDGKPAYFESKDYDRICLGVQASASMPFVSKPVVIDDKHYLDGGCSIKIPYQWAFDNGYEKVVVILTRENGYRRSEKTNKKMIDLFFGKYPEFRASMYQMNKEANREKAELEKLSEEGKIFLIAPSEEVTVTRLEKDMEKLGDLYWLGYHDAEKRLEDLKKYLGIL